MSLEGLFFEVGNISLPKELFLTPFSSALNNIFASSLVNEDGEHVPFDKCAEFVLLTMRSSWKPDGKLKVSFCDVFLYSNAGEEFELFFLNESE